MPYEDNQEAIDYYRSQGLVLNPEGTEWVKPIDLDPVGGSFSGIEIYDDGPTKGQQFRDEDNSERPTLKKLRSRQFQMERSGSDETLPVATPQFINETFVSLQNPDVSPAEIAAYRQARAVQHSSKLPVADDRSIGSNFFSGPSNPERPAYIMEPDLQEAQGGMHLPSSVYQDAGGGLFYRDTNEPVPTVKRPGILPMAQTPEGIKFAMPRMLDIASNVMGNVGGKVTAKAGEMVLGSGITRLERDMQEFATKNNLPPINQEQVLSNIKGRIKQIEYDRRLNGKPEEGYPFHAELSELRKRAKELENNPTLLSDTRNQVVAEGGRALEGKYKLTPVDYDPFAIDWYHGSTRIDRMEGKIDPRRATSGPMPFFTDNPEMASSYATGKKADTSLMKNDPGDSVANYFTVSPKELGQTRGKTPYTIEQSWNYLSSEKKKEILDKYGKIGYENPNTSEGPYTLHKEHAGLSGEDHYKYILDREAQGNPLKALRIIWHDGGNLINNETDLAEIYKLAGYPHKISEATAPWTEARGVLAAKLNMKNPLLTDQKDVIVNEILPKLEAAFEFDRTRKPAYSASDAWDKNYRYTPKEWVAQAIEDYKKGDNSYVWTTIPDKVTAELKKLGFDGIIDQGGKGGGQAHKVAIPFDIPGIVKSKYSGKTLYSDTRNQVAGQVGHELEKGPFYSQLERQVQQAKINLATPEQWLGYLKNQPGVKADEMSVVLGNLPKEGMLSKAQLEDYVKANKVELKEKVLGNKLTPEQKEWLEIAANRKLDEDELKKFSELEAIKTDGDMNKTNTQYHQYQLPGGSSYKETLFSLLDTRLKYTKENVKVNHEKSGVLWAIETPDNVYNVSKNKFPNEQDAINYVLKNKKPAADNIQYNAPHFNEHGTNLMGHVRTNERTIEGQGFGVRNKVSGNTSEAFPTREAAQKYYDDLPEAMKDKGKLEIVDDLKAPKIGTHVEELQGDWPQNIRDKGYKGEKEKIQLDFDKVEAKLMATNDDKLLGLPTVKQVLEKAVEDKIITKAEANTYKRFTDIENATPAPDMPFKKNWDEVLIKRIIRDAVDKGHKFISVTPGEAQALRYQNEIRQKIDTVRWVPREGKNGETVVSIKPTSGNTDIYLDVDKKGNILNGHKELKGKTLDEAIGKDIARQILEKPEGNINAKGYVMGAEGMKGYYDKMVIDKFNSIVKKYGAKMEVNGEHLPDTNKYTIKRTGDIHDEERGASVFHVYKNGDVDKTFKTRKEAEDYSKSQKGQPIHIMHITPELEKKAKEGFELFSSSPVMVPVDHTPEFDNQPKGHIEPGNIDLNKRPVVKNADGSISTVRSMDVHLNDEDKAILGRPGFGKRVLIPTVSDDGKILSDEEAVKLFNNTKKHLGKFKNSDTAKEYAEKLHQSQAKQYRLTPVAIPPVF